MFSSVLVSTGELQENLKVFGFFLLPAVMTKGELPFSELSFSLLVTSPTFTKMQPASMRCSYY